MHVDREPTRVEVYAARAILGLVYAAPVALLVVAIRTLCRGITAAGEGPWNLAAFYVCPWVLLAAAWVADWVLRTLKKYPYQ